MRSIRDCERCGQPDSVPDVYSTIDIRESGATCWREVFEAYRRRILIEHRDHPLICNYGPERLKVEAQTGFFLTVNARTREVAKFSTVFHPSHWPDKVMRVYNRTWVDPAYRTAGLERKLDFAARTDAAGPPSPMERQIRCARDNGAELVVMSREFGPGFVNRGPSLVSADQSPRPAMARG